MFPVGPLLAFEGSCLLMLNGVVNYGSIPDLQSRCGLTSPLCVGETPSYLAVPSEVQASLVVSMGGGGHALY